MILFIPVTVSIGIINIDSFLNATLGTLVSPHASVAINDAFRLYMLPQGVFSVAVTTVLFPTLTRMGLRRDVSGMRRTLGTGVRQINLLLIPSAALMAVLATPIVRLVYQRHAFNNYSTHIVSTALLWFAFSLPFSGVNLLFTRTFFALKRPWIPTRLAAMNVAVDIVVSLILYRPLGIAGLIIGTLVANIFMTWLQARRLRIGFNGRLEGPQTLMITVRICVATAIATALGYVIWKGLDSLLGLSFIAQLVSVGLALLVAGAVYFRLVLLMRIPEARQIEALVRSRLPGR
jgi:putative peptidoglycan lipid II flippase